MWIREHLFVYTAALAPIRPPIPAHIPVHKTRFHMAFMMKQMGAQVHPFLLVAHTAPHPWTMEDWTPVLHPSPNSQMLRRTDPVCALQRLTCVSCQGPVRRGGDGAKVGRESAGLVLAENMYPVVSSYHLRRRPLIREPRWESPWSTQKMCPMMIALRVISYPHQLPKE